MVAWRGGGIGVAWRCLQMETVAAAQAQHFLMHALKLPLQLMESMRGRKSGLWWWGRGGEGASHKKSSENFKTISKNFEINCGRFRKILGHFPKVFRKILTIKLFVKFRINNGHISGCFKKYYQNFWVLFWKFSKKISEGFKNCYGEFRKVIRFWKFRGNLYVFQNSEEIKICSKILRKFKGTVRKLLFEEISPIFWKYF